MRQGDKSDEGVLFHRTGSISSDKSRLIGFLKKNTTIVFICVQVYLSCVCLRESVVKAVGLCFF